VAQLHREGADVKQRIQIGILETADAIRDAEGLEEVQVRSKMFPVGIFVL
jgi:hypothetical protein